MNINDIKIPSALQFSMDDIGWVDGRTTYWDGFQPTKTGLPRYHCLADYKAVNEIGRVANMKICGMFVIGDWDRIGAVAKAPFSNKLGKNWERSPYISEELEEIRDFVNSCEYLELAFHGLQHECWNDDGECVSGEFSPPPHLIEKIGQEAYLRAHFDAFFEIYNDWGFAKPPRAHTCPGGCWKFDMMPKILNEYGIRYWHEPNFKTSTSTVSDGVISTRMKDWIALWEAYDVNPDKFPLYTEETAGIMVSHWPNYLRLDPDLNLENLNKWKNFFDRQRTVFGVIVSRDLAFAHHQQLYKTNCTVTEENGKVKIDCSKVDEIKPDWFDAPIYISVKDGVEFQCEGGVVTEFEKLDGFTNYEIKRTGDCAIYLK